MLVFQATIAAQSPKKGRFVTQEALNERTQSINDQVDDVADKLEEQEEQLTNLNKIVQNLQETVEMSINLNQMTTQLHDQYGESSSQWSSSPGHTSKRTSISVESNPKPYNTYKKRDTLYILAISFLYIWMMYNHWKLQGKKGTISTQGASQSTGKKRHRTNKQLTPVQYIPQTVYNTPTPPGSSAYFTYPSWQHVTYKGERSR